MEQSSYLYLHNESTGYIQLWELLLTPIFLTLLYGAAFIIKNKYYRNSPVKKYYFRALTLKLIGAVSLCLIYSFYYKGGDTCNYFREGKNVSSVIYSNPVDGIRLLFSTGGKFDPDLLQYFPSLEFENVENTYMVVKITALFETITLQSFLISSLLFGFFSFWAIWKIFCLFCSYKPSLTKEFAISFLFIPSVFFWGSGILKDTVCLTCLAFLFCSIDSFFLKRKNLILSGLSIILTTYILTTVKVYIIMSFGICLVTLILLNYRSKIKSRNLRLFITPIFLFISVIIGAVLIKFISESSVTNNYSMDNIMKTSSITREYITSVGGGSTYSLGDIDDNSLWGMIKIFPAGVNVTLFRPYIWEAHNFISLISAFESFFILILTIRILYTVGIVNVVKIILSNNLIFFCLFFAIIFAFSVGISSYNFGTLVRYKIPCIPFYLSGLYMILQIHKEKTEQRKLKKKSWQLNQIQLARL